jgi:hypothetical protein
MQISQGLGDKTYPGMDTTMDSFQFILKVILAIRKKHEITLFLTALIPLLLMYDSSLHTTGVPPGFF